MSGFVLPPDFNYVIASLALVPFVNIYIDMTVMRLRKKANVPLPDLFADKEEAKQDPAKSQFNCAQKASLNFSEHVGSFVTSALVCGFFKPKLASTFVVAWVLGRLIYHIGYSSGDPSKRMFGFIQGLSFLGMTISGAYFAISSLL